jgi:hypothetical protein
MTRNRILMILGLVLMLVVLAAWRVWTMCWGRFGARMKPRSRRA